MDKVTRTDGSSRCCSTSPRWTEEQGPLDLKVRIHARLSGLAIADKEPRRSENPHYYDRLIRERELLEKLFDLGAEFRVILSWNVEDFVTLGELGDMNAIPRLEQLAILKRVFKDRDRCVAADGH